MADRVPVHGGVVPGREGGQGPDSLGQGATQATAQGHRLGFEGFGSGQDPLQGITHRKPVSGSGLEFGHGGWSEEFRWGWFRIGIPLPARKSVR